MKKITKITVKFNGSTVGMLSLTPDDKLCVFEYSHGWVNEGFSISPFQLPLRPGIFIAKPQPFAGNFGIFEDSLPDGYGRYLLHKALLREGIDDSRLSALDRLSLVGNGGMGALEYQPVMELMDKNDVADFDSLQNKALEVLKEYQDKDARMLLYRSGNSGGARPKVLFSDATGHWLVKFRHTYDPVDIGMQEYTYNEAARGSGIIVPDFKLINGKYFASRRFDISPGGERCHTATAGALLNLSLSEPYLDYKNLLALTGYLTQNQQDVEQMFRRMVFNYLIDNKDDHCKNFSFLIVRNEADEWQWRLAPAYDLTLCTEGYNGEHATSVNGKARPRLADFIALGTGIRISEKRCRHIISQLQEACSSIMRYEIK